MKIKGRIIVYILTAIVTAVFLSVNSFAMSEDFDRLYDTLPEDAKKIIEDSGVTPENNGLADFDVVEILNGILGSVTDNIEKPIRMFGSILAVIILSALVEGLSGASVGNRLAQVISVVSAITSVVIISAYIAESIDSIKGIITASSDFMLAYVPVLAGVLSVSGHVSSASVFSSVSVVGIQLLSRIASSVLLPFVTCILGISVTSAFGDDFNLNRLSDGIRKGVIWGLGFIMTLFIGILTLQTVVTSSADSVGLKTLRFAVSSAVPFVGNAVSDALSTVKTSVSLLKTGIGGFGVAAASAVILPTLISVICYRVILFFAGIISDIFGCNSVSGIIRSGENVMSILFAIISCVFVFITITTAMMLVICRAV